jgi:hypothetical protein
MVLRFALDVCVTHAQEQMDDDGGLGLDAPESNVMDEIVTFVAKSKADGKKSGFTIKLSAAKQSNLFDTMLMGGS